MGDLQRRKISELEVEVEGHCACAEVALAGA